MGAPPPDPYRIHRIRLLVAWAVLSVVGIAVIFLLPIPPGSQTAQADSESRTLTLLTIFCWPVMAGIVLWLAYHLIFLRQARGRVVDGPPEFGNLRIQVGWVVISSLIVLSLAVYGIVTLASEQAVAAGSGTSSGTISGPTGTLSELNVQVIAQQWYFTYRYPDYGGVESLHLMLPVGVAVQLHVTSLDVIHSFWAYQLGVKADANPGVDNIAVVTPEQLGSFQVRCAELCGIWHGAMADSSGAVVSAADFMNFINQQQANNGDVAKYLPPYTPGYFPTPLTKGH